MIRIVIQTAFLLASAFSLVYFDFTFVAVVMAVSLLGGAWFCGWVCPFGSAQDWIAALGRRLFKRRLKIPKQIEKYLSPLRYLLLALSLAGLGATAFLSRPYQDFSGLISGHTAYVSWAAWTLLAFFLVSSLLIDRPFCRYFCRYFCLEGAQYGLLSFFRVLTLKRKPAACLNCGACDKACPSGVVVSERDHVRHPACINCLRCVSACPVKGCLTYTVFWNRRKE